MWAQLIGLWLICDGIISLVTHLPDRRQTWTNDHSVRVIRVIMGLMLVWLNRDQLARFRKELRKENSR